MTPPTILMPNEAIIFRAERADVPRRSLSDRTPQHAKHREGRIALRYTAAHGEEGGDEAGDMEDPSSASFGLASRRSAGAVRLGSSMAMVV